MLRLTTLSLLLFLSGAASADVLDHHHGLLERILHQLFDPHHLPFTALLVAVAIIALRRWRTARK